MNVEAGPWVECPRCGEPVGLARFAPSDEEPDVAVAVCIGCAERVALPSAAADGP